MPRKARTIVNEAQRILDSRKVTLGQLAGVTHKSRPAASAWMHGTSRPDEETRAVLEEEYGIAPELWDRRPNAPDPAPSEDANAPNPPKPEDLSKLTARQAALEHLGRIRELRKREQTNSGPDVLKLLDMERRAILDFAKFNGELSATEESRLTETKRWKEVRQALIATLVQFPEAAKAIALKLEELGA